MTKEDREVFVKDVWGLSMVGGDYYKKHLLEDILKLPDMFAQQDFGWLNAERESHVKYAILTYEKDFFELARKTLENKNCVWIKDPKEIVSEGNCVAIIYDIACENETLLGQMVSRINSRVINKQGNVFYPVWVVYTDVHKGELVDAKC